MPKTPNATCVFLKHGGFLDLANPDPADINIYDIASGLAGEQRWAGQCNGFYSVAQHSVFVMDLVPDRHKLAALLHDAGEYLWGDIPSPGKRVCREIKIHEKRLLAAVGSKWGLTLDDFAHSTVKRADKIAAMTERRDITNIPEDAEWPGYEGIKPAAQKIGKLLTPSEARALFFQEFQRVLKLHEDLTGISSVKTSPQPHLQIDA